MFHLEREEWVQLLSPLDGASSTLERILIRWPGFWCAVGCIVEISNDKYSGTHLRRNLGANKTISLYQNFMVTECKIYGSDI